MARHTHADDRRDHGPVTYLALVAAIAALGALIFVVVTQVVSRATYQHDSLGHTIVPDFDSTPAGIPTTEGAGCADELAAVSALIEASESGAQNWQGHIQARSDGMAGLITNEEMREIWRITREPGPQDIETFSAANDDYAAVQGVCVELAEANAEFPEACTVSADLAAEAVEAARTLLGEWHGHLQNMAKFADGGMTANEAQSEWETAWARAPDDLAAYDEAVAAFDDAPGCNSGTA
jgi:hypothetical protein